MENTGKHLDRWNNCLQIISQIVEPQHFETWFKKIRPVSLVDSTLTVEVPSDFFREYLEESYLDVIKKTLKRVIGADARLNYLIRPVTNQMPMRLPEGPGNPPVNKSVGISSYQPSGNPGPFVYPGLQKIQIDPRLLPVYNFSNLVAGDCNRLAISAGNDIALNPGKTPFNPLFIFGGPGLGKTHVANAIGLAIKEKYPDLVVLYVTGNEFKTQYMDAVYVRNKLTDFLAYYMKIDVLIIDDIQDLVGQGNQTAFFNIFNHLHQNSKQLILTSDRSPAELQNFEDRLLSRFKWGLSVELTHPDYATRLAMLKARAFREGMNIGDDVLEYLASNIQTNFRELEGALISVAAHAALSKEENSVELASRVTRKIVGIEVNNVTIDKVQKAVCDYFNITRESLLSPSRKRQIVQARQISMYLCRSMITNCSLSSIGAETGGKDHATVLHACATVADLMATDKTFKRYVSDLESMLAPSVR
ncbi:MAG: chromosomal replication initiator protein DnaA [Bacteroidales bacterium]|jgi:chromosomal replication initiator protein|nr:chromosomal replication initiator protein DnaA [Bacteroidales bacterium]